MWVTSSSIKGGLEEECSGAVDGMVERKNHGHRVQSAVQEKAGGEVNPLGKVTGPLIYG